MKRPYRIEVELVFPANTIGNAYPKSIFKDLDFVSDNKDAAKLARDVLVLLMPWINKMFEGLVELKIGGLKEGVISYSLVN